MRILSKLTAMLLALMMVLAAPLTAVAESTAIETEEQYKLIAAQILFDVLMQSETHMGYRDIQAYIEESDYAEFLNMLDAETRAKLEAYIEQLYWDSFVSSTSVPPLLMPPIDFSDAVSAQERSAMFTTQARAENDAVQLSKEAKFDTDGNMYLELSAYATGSVTIQKESVACDVVLVLDMSNSMDNSMSKSDTTTRLAALQKAVTAFVSNIENDAVKNEVDHRVSIITFGPESGATIKCYLKNMLKNSAAVKTAATLSKNTKSGTVPAPGFTAAKTVFDDTANNDEIVATTRNRVVVFFTDGSPTTERDEFQAEHAQDAINAAQSLKQPTTVTGGYGATLYAIAVIGSAGPSGAVNWTLADGEDGTGETIACINAYMHAVSSNSPNASCSNYVISNGVNKVPGYYLTAANTADLSSIFQQISETVSGSTTVTLDKEATVKDIIADSFTLPTNASANDIEAYIVDYTGDGTWEAETEWEAVDKSYITVDTTENSVSVKGFSYKDNYVWDNGETDEKYGGKKLVIRIPIMVKPGFLGGNNVTTNAEGSAIYDGSGNPVAYFTSPTVNVPIQDLIVSAVDKYIYLSNVLSDEDLIVGAAIEDYYGTTIALDPTKRNFGLADWQLEYVNLTVTPQTAVAQPLLDDGTYSIACTVKPLEAASTTSIGTANGMSGKTATASAKIYVYKPVITFKDTSHKYLSSDVTDNGTDYYTKNNFDGLVWQHDTLDYDDGATMDGVLPAVTYTYAPTETAWLEALESGYQVIGTECQDVNITEIKLTSTQTIYTRTYTTDEETGEITENITESSLVSWYSEGNGTVAYHNGTNVTSTTENIENAHITTQRVTAVCDTCEIKTSSTLTTNLHNTESPEFVIHINDVLGSLKITKAIGSSMSNADDTFLFTVFGPGIKDPITVVIKGEGSITINDLLVGNYTVTEDTSWSWRYTCTSENATETATVVGNDTVEVTFTNTVDSTQWLDGSTYAENKFDKYTDVTE